MADKPSILLAEDDKNLSLLLEEYLNVKGFTVMLCGDGEQALDAFSEREFDLCILDIMMPKMDGFSLAREIKRLDKDMPIIFLTAKSMKEDKLEGFSIGADDYLTKPFSMEELLARVNAILRRSRKDERATEVYTFGKFNFDYNTQNLSIDSVTSHLTTKESELLRMLCQKPNEVLEREIALKRIWGNDSYFTARSMDVFITKLRKYLKPDPSVQIVNVHGTGYKLLVQ
jgi:DNA-binding response OmpR family regulator